MQSVLRSWNQNNITVYLICFINRCLKQDSFLGSSVSVYAWIFPSCSKTRSKTNNYLLKLTAVRLNSDHYNLPVGCGHWHVAWHLNVLDLRKYAKTYPGLHLRSSVHKWLALLRALNIVFCGNQAEFFVAPITVQEKTLSKNLPLSYVNGIILIHLLASTLESIFWRILCCSAFWGSMCLCPFSQHSVVFSQMLPPWLEQQGPTYKLWGLQDSVTESTSAKLAPPPAQTIPMLELWACFLALEMAELILASKLDVL